MLATEEYGLRGTPRKVASAALALSPTPRKGFVGSDEFEPFDERNVDRVPESFITLDISLFG